jgi:hypothetical protein
MISITCQRSAELVSQSLDMPLSRWQRLVLNVHVGICGPCSRFRRQLLLLQRAGQRLSQDQRVDRVANTLSEAARERMKRRLLLEGPGGPG